MVDITKFADTPFFSTVLKALEKVPQRAMPAKELDSLLLKYGAKPKELKYVVSRTDPMADLGQATGEERASLLREGLPKIGEKRRGGNSSGSDPDRFYEVLADAVEEQNPEAFAEWVGLPDQAYFDEQTVASSREDILNRLRSEYGVPDGFLDNYGNENPTKYSEYTTEGRVYPADNYNELTVQARDPGARNYYYSSHWDDTQDPLYHLRYKDMDLPSGKKGLFLEEMQSDWNQEGRKAGYLPSSMSEQERLKLRLGVDSQFRELAENAGNMSEDAYNDAYEDLFRRRRELDQYDDKGNKKVPTNPLMPTEDWVDNAIRRSVYEAASRGHDRLGWTDAMTQGKRWNAVTDTPSFRMVLDQHPQYRALREDFLRLQREGAPSAERAAASDAYTNFENELARKYSMGEFEGTPVVIDNARYLGMNKFYDEIVPSRMRKLITKYGGMVESPKDHTWEAQLPDELLKKYLQEGVPFFKDGGSVNSDRTRVRRTTPGDYALDSEGNQMTEKSVTVNHPDINGGRWTNIPSIYWLNGSVMRLPEGPGLEDMAVRYAKESGDEYPSFDTLEEAVAAAIARSKHGGRFEDLP